MPHRASTVLSVVVLVATVGAAGCRGDRPAEAGRPAARPSIRVEVGAVEGRDEPVMIDATGSFEARESSDVAPQASGRVIATPVDVGRFVAAGATLVRLQGVEAGLRLDEARATIKRMEANLALAESQDRLAKTTAERYSALLTTGDVSRTMADQAQTQAETSLQSVNTASASLGEARAQLALAEKAAADVVVVAPFAGYVSDRKVSVGEFVQPSTPVVTLLEIDPLRLRLTIPAVQAGQLAIGQIVRATVDAYPDRRFEGRITAVSPAIAPESRSFVAEAAVPNRDATIKPGMFAVAQVEQGRTMRVAVVPRPAVVEDVNTNSFRVFVVDSNDRAHLRVVQLAPRQDGDTIRVISGVKEGERVATTNLGQLYDTAQVAVGSAPGAGTQPSGHAEAR